MPLLTVKNLAAGYRPGVPILRDISFIMREAESVAVIGESGCGKTTLAKALMGLMPHQSGSVTLQGAEILSSDAESRRKLRGAQIALIPQEPGLSLNPVMTAGDQIAEVARAHPEKGGDARQRAMHALERTGLDPKEFYKAYPHQLSGGQRQRVSIAQAIVCDPLLVIADEPSSALDEASHQAILQLFRNLMRSTSFLIIAHDPDAVADFVDRILVLYAGEMVESGPSVELLTAPLHPYTKALLACAKMPDPHAGRRLNEIGGITPSFPLTDIGCVFENRCRIRQPQCATIRPQEVCHGERTLRCLLNGKSES